MSAAQRVALVLCCLAASFAQAQPPPPAPAGECARHAPVPWQPVAPGVWAWPPAQPTAPGPGNAGHVQAISVLVDRGEAMVVDPGPSLRHGQRVRASIECRFKARVRWVVNTHAHAENVLGNAAFADLQDQGQAEIAANASTLEAMRQRCPACLANMQLTVGDAAMRGTGITLPRRVLAAGELLQVGGRQVEVRIALHAHTEGDLVLWLPSQRVLWAGGLVSDVRLPELAQGSLRGWLDALDQLAQLEPAPRAVIATGVSRSDDGQPVPALIATRSYLQHLRRHLLAALEAGLHGGEPEVLKGMAPGGWVGFEARHAFNVQRAWREVEAEWLAGGAGPSPPPAKAPSATR